MPDQLLINEKILVTRVAEGDAHAFRAIFDHYRLRLYTFLLHLTHSAADAEELVQETFLSFWEHRDRLVTIEHPGKYLYTIARNKALNYLAKAARDRQLERQLWLNLSQSGNPTAEFLEGREGTRLVAEAVAQLSAQKQTIFHLSREQGLTQEQIATKMGISKSRVNNLLVEVLRHIKDYLSFHSPLLAALFWLDHGHHLF